MFPLDRRAFLPASALAAGGFPFAFGYSPRTRLPKRGKPAAKKIALVTTAYYYLSHAYHIGGRFLDGYMKGDEHHFPDFGITSAFVEQVKANDLSRDLAKDHGFRLSETIDDALTLGARASWPSMACCSSASTATIPTTRRGRSSIRATTSSRRSSRCSRRAARAYPSSATSTSVTTARRPRRWWRLAAKMNVPFMAGSSLPVTWRRLELDLKLGTKITDAPGRVARRTWKSWAFTPLETLQCMVEHADSPNGDPKPANQGVKAVTCLQGDEVWKAGDDGLWSWELLEHAIGRSPSRAPATSAPTAAGSRAPRRGATS